jgi:hypothetical protein
MADQLKEKQNDGRKIYNCFRIKFSKTGEGKGFRAILSPVFRLRGQNFFSINLLLVTLRHEL